jgi:uncharacterized protein YneF (UPF0154 family)
MRNFFKEGLLFIRKNPEILFSLLLIFVIPLALYYNLFFTIKSFQKNVNYELQTRALLVESILSVLAKNYISNPEILQKTLEDYLKENPDISKEISQLEIISYQDGKFKILASTNPNEVGQEIKEKEKRDRLAIAWGKEGKYHSIGEKRRRKILGYDQYFS